MWLKVILMVTLYIGIPSLICYMYYSSIKKFLHYIPEEYIGMTGAITTTIFLTGLLIVWAILIK